MLLGIAIEVIIPNLEENEVVKVKVKGEGGNCLNH